MSVVIRVQCACGTTIKTDDKNAGKLARCPDCREMVPLPGGKSGDSAAVLSLSDGTVCLQAICPCGRVLRTSMENAGKAARCPECGEVVPLPAIRKKVSRGEPQQSRGSRRLEAISPEPLDPGSFPVVEEDQLDWDGLPDPEERVAKPKRRKKRVEETDEDEDDASESRSRKKKKSEDEDSGVNTWLILGGAGAFLVTAGLVAALFFFMPQPGAKNAEDDKPGELPKGMEFVDFTKDGMSFTSVYPKQWEFRASGGQGGIPPVVIFQDGTAKIEFRSNQRGSATAMIMQPNADPNKQMDDSLKPVSRIHEMNRKRFEEDISGYTEIGQPRMVKVRGFGGEGRVSDYTCNSGLFGAARGYRVTLIGLDQWNVFCQCPEDSWKKYQPIFDKVLASAGGG